MSENSFDRLLRQALRRTPDAGPCPDPAELAALYEDAVSPEERLELERHASNCAHCSGQLAVLARLGNADERSSPAPARGLFAWRWRWLIPVATAVVVFAVWSDMGRRPRSPDGQRVEMPAAHQPSEPHSSIRAREYEESRDSTQEAREPVRENDQERRQTAATPPAVPPPAAEPPPSELAKSNEESEDRVLSDAAREQRPPPGAPARVGAETAAPAETEAAAGSPSKDEADAGRADRFRAKTALSASSPTTPLIVRAGTATLMRVTDKGIQRSVDDGMTWQTDYSGASGGLLVGVCPSIETCWFGGEAGRVLQRTGSGRWIEHTIPGGAAIVRIDAENAQRATLTTRDGRRLSTNDAGRSWTSVD